MRSVELPAPIVRALIARHNELAEISEPGPGVTRLFATQEHLRAIDRLRDWMTAAGMTTRVDAAGNLIGRWAADPAAGSDAKTLLVGSHQDTVRQGGRYDGAMGVLLPTACVEALAAAGHRLAFHVDVLCFCDEEGTRFGTSFIGSEAIAGIFDGSVLDREDANGVRMRDAMRQSGFEPERISTCAYQPSEILGYVEVHIEQGPVLEQEDLPVGVVTGIAVGGRYQFTVTGVPGHAGTVPMARRQDALTAAAAMLLACEAAASERPDVVATVGRLEVSPGAANVIPGEVTFTLDLRAPDDTRHAAALEAVTAAIERIASERQVTVRRMPFYHALGCTMDDSMRTALTQAIQAEGLPPRELFSGAGHDALALRHIGPVGMLFVRCRGGISHHPDEYAYPADMVMAARVLLRFLVDFVPPTRA